MSSLEFIKFPNIQSSGRTLVWDSRQTVDSDELIFISSELQEKSSREKLELRLKNNKNSKFSKEARLLGEYCSEYYKHPSQRIKVIGITGTNGKTTCCYLGAYLSSFAEKTAYLGTMGLKIFSFGKIVDEIEVGYTTPLSPILHNLLFQLERLEVKNLFLEVSSHGIAQYRIAGLNFYAKALTNITQDHLDFHRSFENYQKCKIDFLTRDEGQADKIFCFEEFSSLIEVSTVVLPDHYQVTQSELSGQTFKLQESDLFTPLIGEFNLRNVSLVYSLLKTMYQKSVLKELMTKLKSFSGVPGRMQKVQSISKNVFIDYSHTPDALKNAISAMRPFCEEKLIVLFGCGGNRDKDKRSQMGAIAVNFSDEVYLTSDNPRDEDPQKIIDDIYLGMENPESKNIFVEIDRKLAIKSALKTMHKDDVLLICGKGHEEYQLVNGVKAKFSDYEVVSGCFS